MVEAIERGGKGEAAACGQAFGGEDLRLMASFSRVDADDKAVLDELAVLL